MFLIYINDLFENLVSVPKLFPGDTSIFSVVKIVDALNIDMNNDLKKIYEWAFEWRMNFNPDPTSTRIDFFLGKGKWLITLLYFSIKMSFCKSPFKNI